MKTDTRRMVETALMLAIGTVLSVLSFQGVWALGGSITFCSMLPLVVLSWRWGWKWGLLCGLVFGILQMCLGYANVQYATSVGMAAAIILLDYVLAFSVIGLAGLFRGRLKQERAGIIVSIAVTFFLRFLCHFLSGVLIWEALWPNELGWAAPVWSAAYNGSFMVPELLITGVAAFVSWRPLERYYLGRDIGE